MEVEVQSIWKAPDWGKLISIYGLHNKDTFCAFLIVCVKVYFCRRGHTFLKEKTFAQIAHLFSVSFRHEKSGQVV